MDDACHFVLARQIDRVVSARDIQRFDENALSDLGFNEVRLAPHAIMREHDLFTRVQKSPGCVQSNESQPTCDQNHGAASSVLIITVDVSPSAAATAQPWLIPKESCPPRSPTVHNVAHRSFVLIRRGRDIVTALYQKKDLALLLLSVIPHLDF